MKRVLLDTHVVLDVLLDRKPHAAASAAVWAVIEAGAAEGLLAAHAVTTVHYLLRREPGMAKARRTMGAMLRVFGVAPVDSAVIQDALRSPGGNFEDSVTAAAPLLAHSPL